MEDSSKKEPGNKKDTEVKTFKVPFALGEMKENITINTNTTYKPAKEQIINQAFKFHSQGNIVEAARYYQYCINQGLEDHRVYSNYGTILLDLGKSQDAELSYRKAIELNPDYDDAHLNLGRILIDLEKKKEAELSLAKQLNLNLITQRRI